jgi:membrane protein implicated in regulation of membrane protease activity
LLFQIPQWFFLALFLWFLADRNAVSLWVSQGFFILWIVKDLVIFPWVRRAYTNDAKTGTEQLIGAKAVAQERLNPEGFVKINGELWKARLDPVDQSVSPKSIVKVRAANGLTLIVEAENRHLEQLKSY